MILTVQELVLIGVALGALLLIVSSALRADLVAVLALLVLALTGVVSPEEALVGFSQSAVITIIGLFVITRGLEETGVVNALANRLRTLGGVGEARMVFLTMAVGALLSLAMNNIAAGALLLPAIAQVARESDIPPSKLLIPLAFGTLVGGMATYFTTANIILSGLLVAQGQTGLTMGDFLPVGGLIVVCALIFMVLIGRRLLPRRESASINLSPRRVSRSLYETYQLEERLWEFVVLPGSVVAGRALRDSQIGEKLGVTVLAIWRGHQAILTPPPECALESGDLLLILGREDRIVQLADWGMRLGREGANGAHHQRPFEVDLTEVIIPPRSSAISRTLTDLRFRSKYGLTAVALWREGRSYRTDVGRFALHEGDALLMVGVKARIDLLARERDFLVLQSAHALSPAAPQKAPVALAITLIVLALAIFDIIPIPLAALGGAAAMTLTGCLNMDEAYQAIEWRIVFLIAGLLPLSIGLVETGLSEQLGAFLTQSLLPFGALGMIAGFFAAAALVTQVIGGQVAALVVGPVAVSAALAAGVNPQAAAVAVAIGCSAAFLTPVAHPVNILMMGPGGYTPRDFPRVGVWMLLLTGAALIAGFILFWGIQPG
ncbi:MAG: anion permease [Anaerolineae bacterium]|nr:anion permease [Anaerolineae bacterium]NUQ07234.1 anion permease [Anaerolineae bacterium]